MTSASLQRIPAVILAGVLLAGCSELTDPAVPSAPSARRPAPTLRARELVSSATPDGTVMTMVDETDGVTYSLNVAARTITRVDDNVVLELTPGQADSMATAFLGAIGSDPSIAGLEAVGSLSAGGEPVGCKYDVCETSVGADLMVMQPIGDEKRHYPSHTAVRPVVRRRGEFGVTDVTSIMQGDPCTNIINAALPKVINYRGYRERLLKQGFSSFTERLVDGVLVKFVPLGDAAAAVSTSIANFMTAQVAIGFLAGNWTSYGCRGADVVAGPYNYSGGSYSMTFSTGTYACHKEEWKISWDGGKTWEGIEVKVCEFKEM